MKIRALVLATISLFASTLTYAQHRSYTVTPVPVTPRGQDAVTIKEVPADYVKDDLLVKMKLLKLTVVSEGKDSIQVVSGNKAFIYYFQQDGVHTIFSQRTCLDNDCSKETPVSQQQEEENKKAMQNLALVIEQDYKNAVAKALAEAPKANPNRPIVALGNTKAQLLNELELTKKEWPSIKIDSTVEGRFKPRTTLFMLNPVERFGLAGTFYISLDKNELISRTEWAANKISDDDFDTLVEMISKTFGTGTPQWENDKDHEVGWRSYLWKKEGKLITLKYFRDRKEIAYITQPLKN